MFKKLILAGVFIFLANSLAAQVTPLKKIADIITHPSDRLVLEMWESRLDTYRKGLQRIAEIRIAECDNTLPEVFEARNCPEHYRALQKQMALYEFDAEVFNLAVDMATGWARRDSRPLTSSEQVKKVDYILKALFEGGGDWGKSMAYMNNHVANNPRDRAAKEALTYLRSLSSRVLLGGN